MKNLQFSILLYLIFLHARRPNTCYIIGMGLLQFSRVNTKVGDFSYYFWNQVLKSVLVSPFYSVFVVVESIPMEAVNSFGFQHGKFTSLVLLVSQI